jgi:hypothetical protein
MPFGQYPAVRLVVALGVGLMIGAERERRKGVGRHRSAAAVRTFALTTLAGGISFLIGRELLVAVAAATVAIFGAETGADYDEQRHEGRIRRCPRPPRLFPSSLTWADPDGACRLDRVFV